MPFLVERHVTPFVLGRIHALTQLFGLVEQLPDTGLALSLGLFSRVVSIQFFFAMTVDSLVFVFRRQGKLVDQRKTFREGEALVFDNSDLQLVLVTVASLADSLFKSVAEYARSVKEGK